MASTMPSGIGSKLSCNDASLVVYAGGNKSTRVDITCLSDAREQKSTVTLK